MAAAQREAGFKLALPARVPAGARLLAVVVSRPPTVRGQIGEFGIILTGPPYKVHSVFLGSPAHKAGILPKDRILLLDGRPPDKMAPDSVLRALRFSGRGPAIIRLRRGSTTRTVRLYPPVSPIPLAAPGARVGLTYARPEGTLTLSESHDDGANKALAGKDSGWVTVGDGRAAVSDLGAVKRLLWRYNGLTLDLQAARPAFSEDEILEFARSIR